MELVGLAAGLFVGASLALALLLVVLHSNSFRRWRWSSMHDGRAPAACATCQKHRGLVRSGTMNTIAALFALGAFSIAVTAVGGPLETMLVSAIKRDQHVALLIAWGIAWSICAIPGVAFFAFARVEPQCAACDRPRWCETCRKMRPTIHAHPAA